MSIVTLPPGHHYAVLWGIQSEFAGMTNSTLRRSRAFVKRAAAAITILTYEHCEDLDSIRTELRSNGALMEDMGLRNLWEDLRTWDDTLLRQVLQGQAAPPAEAFDPLLHRGDREGSLIRRLRDESGRAIQTDYLRRDGTLLASDRAYGPGLAKRAVTLCDTHGEPVATWSKMTKLYYSWLDTLPRDPAAWLICDSKTSARHLTRYKRPGVVKIHVIRGTHLQPETGRPHGELAPSRQHVMKNLPAWDAVVTLTNGQRRDIETLLGPQQNLHVIPNDHDVPPTTPNLNRDPRAGIMLASLTARKRISHAAAAVLLAGRICGRRITLDVWGSGEPAAKLRSLLLLGHGRIRLRGYSPDASEGFQTKSFSLLTSTSEAAPRVLIESMGHGCIPISYDTPYGPADIIAHGVNGFLVPNGDYRALSRQIRAVATMSPTDLSQIRLAAHKRALEFTDSTPQWTTLLHQLWLDRQI